MNISEKITLLYINNTISSPLLHLFLSLIFHKNGTLSFSHLNVKYLLSLDEIQITLYSLMVNFFSNIQIYSATNDQNVKSIDEQGNFILTVIFRFSYGFIALVLLIYCNVYMLLIWVYHLFSFLIKEMSSQIDNKECLSF